MRKTIISAITVITVLLAGATTILALDLVNEEDLKITKTTAIPVIETADEIITAQESNNIETTVNTASTNNSKTTAAETNTASMVNAQVQNTSETNVMSCEYCGNAHDHYYEDLNGDGICHHYNCNHYHNNTNGYYHCQGYVDNDNNGICDYCGNYGNGSGNGHGHHAGNAHHQGYQRNHR